MTKYGTPEEVVFCRRCVMSNQRPSSVVEWQSDGTRKPTLGFNADGVCAACEYQTIMDTQIDWEARSKELWDLCSQARSKVGNWDCVVPGSGGKDSTYAAHILKTKYGMHPLLVTWAPHMYTDVGRRNADRWASISDHVLFTPNREVHRKLTRLAFLNLCHPFQPFILGQRIIGPRFAQHFGIDLVFFGENQAQYAGPVADNFKPTMDPKFYEWSSQAQAEATRISGLEIDDLVREHGLDAHDLRPYCPIVNAQLEVHYLGFYLKWSQQAAFYYSQQHCGFEVNDERTEGSYSKYSSIDDKIDPLHYYTQLAKFGIGRATFDASQEIRAGIITRDEGVALVKRYDTEFPQRYFAECLEYMGITRTQFSETIEAAYPEHLWERIGDYHRLKHAVYP